MAGAAITPPDNPPEGFDAAIRNLLVSNSFRRAPTLHRLLQYLWDNRDRELTEYAIATDVLQRKADFDPKIDSVVRVHILRLRQKLKEYYESEGTGAAIRFAIPAGSLGLRGEFVDTAAVEPLAVPPALPQQRRSWPWPALAFVLAVVAATGWYQAIRGRDQAVAPASALPEFWVHAIRNGNPSRVVLPTPVFLQWPGRSLRARDFRINDFDGMLRSPELRPMIERYGPPTLSQSYSVMSASLAAASLTQYLALRGSPVQISPEGQLGLDTFARENLIFLGIPHTSRWVTSLLESTNFRMDPHGQNLDNLKPQPGEPARFLQTVHSQTRRVGPYLLALLPGKERGTRMLVLGGQTSALSSFLTSPAGLETMQATWKQHGRPEHFEVVVIAELEGETLVKASIGGFRRVSITR